MQILLHPQLFSVLLNWNCCCCLAAATSHLSRSCSFFVPLVKGCLSFVTLRNLPRHSWMIDHFVFLHKTQNLFHFHSGRLAGRLTCCTVRFVTSFFFSFAPFYGICFLGLNQLHLCALFWNSNLLVIAIQSLQLLQHR